MNEALEKIAQNGSEDIYIRLYETAEAIMNLIPQFDVLADEEAALAYYFLERLAYESDLAGLRDYKPVSQEFPVALEHLCESIVSRKMFLLNNRYALDADRLFRANGAASLRDSREIS